MCDDQLSDSGCRRTNELESKEQAESEDTFHGHESGHELVVGEYWAGGFQWLADV